ncbi:MAG TPA: CSLREA domain-containing protein, partial [Anaerolineae bacterium]|nr:CSLREA domain-containing protein [Anaerolineae bacterium]
MRKCVLTATGLALLLCVLSPLGQPRPAFAFFIVNTTDDSTYDGTCDATHCTLREALTLANSSPGGDYIHVIIPEDDPGCDGVVCTITLSSTHGALPPLQDMSGGTFVNGTSQPDTNPDGPEIVVNGSGTYDCFKIWSPYNTIKGFVINECVYGVTILDAGISYDPAYNTISGNYIGINYDGTTAAGNTQGGIWILNAHDNTIGGTTAQERNIISGNDFYGVSIFGADAHHNKVIGNYIGTSADGTGAVANSWAGIGITSDAHHNAVGGLTSAKRNVISGNNPGGVSIDNGANTNIVLGNYIGTAPNGVDAVPNSVGVSIGSGAHHNGIGYINTIAHNTNYGVRIDGAATTANTIATNSIHSNG